ncbi:MAG: glucosamine--fructose-6-phosphate aminotransferase [Gammaproteobacteria bacterium]|nr:glucosamine--fructose-6-phosphate aminotransferase [Gammaproteobacteria bacterium]
MLKLSNALSAWNTAAFPQRLKSEIENLPSGSLPLEQGTSAAGYVDDSDISVSVLKVTDDEHSLQVTLAVFFTEIVINCGCGDDPMPQHAQCEILLQIDKTTAESYFEVISA